MDIGVMPFISSDRTYIPIRYAAEGLGFKVNWDASDRTVYID